MALISIIEDFHPRIDAGLLARAEALRPALRHEDRLPLPFDGAPLGKGAELLLDFGEHLVGRVTLTLGTAGSHPDAPATVKLFFAETLRELDEDPAAFDGWLSRSWIQEETVHVDELPGLLTLPRRYAFRYLRITVLDTSPKYRLIVEKAVCRTETSADRTRMKPLCSGDEKLDRIHAVSLKTLADCMQEELEDGPKRDRRLWLGDLRLQALTNAVSFRNFDLVKRCLYLFGGSRFPDGRVSANVFAGARPEGDDTFLFDYALLFPAALEEYLEETNDAEALDDLYPIAMEQIDYGLRQQEDGLVNAAAVKDCFIDWSDTLDRTSCAGAVLLYALRYAQRLAERKGDAARLEELRRQSAALRAALLRRFWSEDEQCFVSNGQISAASQVWMVLADAGTPEQARQAMRRALSLHGRAHMTTPYMHHYFVMALLKVGLRAEAEQHLKDYWGGMLDAGADTFWECWEPEKPCSSPYGGLIVNSFCHAWSCTPAYIIEKHLLNQDTK